MLEQIMLPADVIPAVCGCQPFHTGRVLGAELHMHSPLEVIKGQVMRCSVSEAGPTLFQRSVSCRSTT